MSKIICVNYNYLLSFKSVLERLGVNSNDICIIDEGHNIDKVIIEINKRNITINMIERLLRINKRLRTDFAIDLIKPILSNILELTAKYIGKNNGNTKILSIQDFSNQLGYSNVDTFFEVFDKEVSNLIGYITSKEIYKGLSILDKDDLQEQMRKNNKRIEAILNFYKELQIKYFKSIKSKLFYYDNNNRDEIFVKDIDCSTHINKLCNDFFMTFIMSGTLSPLIEYRKKLFNKEKAYLIETKNPFPKENRKIFIAEDITTSYSKRNDPDNKKAILDLFTKILEKYKDKNIAIFFPSYSLINFYKDIIKKLTKSEVYIQGEDDNIEDFDNEKGAVLLAVQAGKFSEGYDWKNIETVIVFGMAYEMFNDVQKAINSYYFEKYNSIFMAYDLPAMNKALQSAGRCIRKDDDKGVIIFADKRYLHRNIFRNLPNYIKEEHRVI
jgi:DNA excision repair protein ERCC-2